MENTLDSSSPTPVSSSSSAAPPAAWKGVIGTLAAAFLGAVLLFGAWSKMLDPVAFARTIEAEGLDFLLSAGLVAAVALALEVGLGSALLLGIRRLWVLLPTAALVTFFLFLTGRAYYRFTQGTLDAEAGCGCFGNLVERTPSQAFWQDLFLLVPPLLLAFLGRSALRAWPRWRLVVVSALTVGALVFAWRAPSLPLDDMATRLRPGVAIADLCAGAQDERVCMPTVAPWLERGGHLVVLADLEDESFGAAVVDLNEVALAGSPGLTVFSDATPEQNHTFFWQYGPAFEITEAPAAMLKPLYRTLPRSFRLEEGVVTETWNGLPPLASSKAAQP